MRQDAYTRLVHWLRILLPVLGLGLLGSVFFLADRPSGEAALPFAQEALIARLRERQITAPWFAGQTDAGDAVLLEAARITSAPDTDRVVSEGVHVVLGPPEDALAELSASRGQIDAAEGVVSFDRGVVLDALGDWRVIATDMAGRLDQTRLWSDLPLNATGPIGELKAGSMTLRRDTTETALVLHFKDGVQILYRPPITE